MTLSTTRLILRDLEEKDIEHLINLMNPNKAWKKLDGPYYPAPPIEKVADLAKGWVEGKHEPRRRFFIADAKTDTVFGTVSRYWISQETLWSAIGIVIYDEALWGKGLGYEAFGLWCQYLFDASPDWMRLDARTWSGNIGMMKLAEKLGFQREATFRKARIVEGEYYDGIGYGILREEWAERYPDGFSSSLS
jgi:RimJ/RimL family protein N-acetyltransferase